MAAFVKDLEEGEPWTKDESSEPSEPFQSEPEAPIQYHPTYLLIDTEDDVVVYWSEIERDLLDQVPHYLEAIDGPAELAIYEFKQRVIWHPKQKEKKNEEPF